MENLKLAMMDILENIIGLTFPDFCRHFFTL